MLTVDKNIHTAVAADNFVEDVHGGFQCEVQKPYVLYRNRANEVWVGLHPAGCPCCCDTTFWPGHGLTMVCA